jgi:lipoyl(octanoyl) transferase
MNPVLEVFDLGIRLYEDVWQEMKRFTDNRTDDSSDEIWLVQHPPVFTLGQAGKEEHLLNPGDIPVIKTDRGGQVTFHGPGQLVAYLLIDIKRSGIGIRDLVTGIENAVIALLDGYGISGTLVPKAPGVYVEGVKVAALGLRIRKGRSYHGLSLNVDMDLAPFSLINPCGYPGLKVTDMASLGVSDSIELIAWQLVENLGSEFGYDSISKNER